MNPRYRILILLGIILLGSAAYYFATTDRSSDYVIIGTVDANQVVVSTKIAGRIEKLNIEDGSEVKQGDVIALLDSAELTAAQQAMSASALSAQQRVEESAASYKMSQGETVSTVAQARAQGAAAESQLKQAQAQLLRTRQDHDRVVALAKQGVASQQDADRAEADLQAGEANVAALQRQVDAAQANLAVAQARTNQAIAAAKTVAQSRADAQSARAQLLEAQARLGYTTVVAPVSGVVSTRVARQGEVVNPGSPIATLVDFGDTWVYADAPETQAVNIAMGDSLTVRLPNGEKMQGKVTYKAAEAEFATQRDIGKTKRDIKSVAIKVKVDNHDHRLVPGMTAEVLVPKSKQGDPR
ncbi:MAG TPA: efflux RND transporter periplasmic adaptor subunit [Terriglobales bacterium]